MNAIGNFPTSDTKALTDLDNRIGYIFCKKKLSQEYSFFTHVLFILVFGCYLYWLGGFVAFVLAVQTNSLLFNNVGKAILLFFMIDAADIDKPAYCPQLP